MKGNSVHIVILIASVIVAGLLGGQLYQMQREISPSRANLSKLPMGGMHKFASDVEWMLFVNYLGSLNTVDNTNVEEVTKRLERLISFDPNLSKIYNEGVAMISIADPVKTVEILKKACENPQLKNNSQIPFYTGFVMVQHMTPPKFGDAIKYFRMAMDRSGGSEGVNYYTSYYYRSKAKVLAETEKMDERMAMMQTLYKEWENATIGSERGEGSSSGDINSQDLKDRLLTAVRNAKNPSEDYKPTPEAVKVADTITSKVFGDSHMCANCMAPYAPGEAFCGNCGTTVKVYGLCPHCGKALKGGEKFCVSTGKAVK